MKLKNLIAVTALAFSTQALATPPMGHPLVGGNSGANANANALGLGVGIGQGGNGGIGGSVGNTTLNAVTESGDYRDLRIVPPAIAPSINTNIICPMVMQGSKAGSVFFFSGSGTHEPDIVPLCVAWHLGQKDVVERMACQASEAYRNANRNCEVQ
jgi:hypothetical protein